MFIVLITVGEFNIGLHTSLLSTDRLLYFLTDLHVLYHIICALLILFHQSWAWPPASDQHPWMLEGWRSAPMNVGRLAINTHVCQKACDQLSCLLESQRSAPVDVGRLEIITHLCWKAGDYHAFKSEGRRSSPMYVWNLAIISYACRQAGDHHPCMSESWRSASMVVGRPAISTDKWSRRCEWSCNR